MKRILGIALLVSLSVPVSALSPAGKALLDQMRAKYQPAPAGQAPAIIPMKENEKNTPMAQDPEFSGQPEGTYIPSPDAPPGSLESLDPTIAHEEDGKMVPGAPKKLKKGKGSKSKAKISTAKNTKSKAKSKVKTGKSKQTAKKAKTSKK